MVEKLPTVDVKRINLGNKQISEILSTLKKMGWKKQKGSLKNVTYNTNVDGDNKRAKFWHVYLRFTNHTDELEYSNNLLIKRCPFEGKKIVAILPKIV